MRARIVIILIFLSLLWVLMLGRAGYLQIVSQYLPNERLKALQKKQFETVVTLNPRRGDVVDRNGRELAVSMTTYSLFADPKLIEEPRKVARKLSQELGLPVRQIEEKLKKNKPGKKRFVWIERQLQKATRDAIDGYKFRGLGFIEESSRIYPNDRLLSHVLGFVGGDGQGLEGLELEYNDQLQAVSKRVSVHRDARGRPLIVNGQIFNQVPDGSDVQLTIDRELQYILEQELTQAVHEHEADSAVGIVLDAQTSEILAMANAPTFDPNHPSDFALDHKRNRAVTDSFEPGSTMKTFVIAGAMARGLIEPNTKFDCEGGVLHIGKRVIREADTQHKFGLLTTSEILALSSNVGATKIAGKLGDEQLRQTLLSFGFGDKTGVDLPGEAKGILQPTPWHEHLLANISFGHGIAATPLQIANAYAAIASGGYLHQPYIVKSVRDHETGEVVDTKPVTLRRILNDDQVAKMKIMLTGVTADAGTGVNARVPGYPVAGKTGTAQKVKDRSEGRGYLRGGYVSSFAGFIPANDPKFVIYIVVDHPRKGYYGAAVAAPVFARVARFAVRHSGLAPVLISDNNVMPTTKRDLSQSRPSVLPIESFAGTSQTASEAHTQKPGSATQTLGTAAKVTLTAALGSGGTAPGATTSAASSGSGVVLSSSVGPAAAVGTGGASTASAAAPTAPGSSEVPDLKGMTLREVIGRITGTGIELRVHGQGFVARTMPNAGAPLASGKELNLYLE